MSPAAATVLVYIIVLLVLAGLFSKLNTPRGRLLVPLGIAGTLTYLTLFIINQTPIFLDEETNALKLLDGILKRTIDPDSVLAHEQIVLVDVAPHTQLIAQPQVLFNDTSATVPIVDRRKLDCFLNWLTLDSVQQHVDVVVNDILLEDVTAADASLRNSLDQLAYNKKLLQAQRLVSPTSLRKATFDLKDLPTYSVDIVEHNGVYFGHALLDTLGRPCLPYALYLHRQHLDPPVGSRSRIFRQRLTNSANAETLVCNWFIPDLILTEQDITGKSLSEPISLLKRVFVKIADFLFGPKISPSAGIARFLPIGLGAACQTEGQRELMEQFKWAKKSGQRVTLVIGSFSDVQDIHETAYGPMHGGLILLNVYLNLIAQRHFVSYEYILFLLVGYCSVARLLIVVRLPSKNDFEKILAKPACSFLFKNAKWVNGRPQFIRILLRFVYFSVKEIGFAQLHYWLLLAILISSAICFGHIINVMGLTIFLAALDFGLRGLREANQIHI